MKIKLFLYATAILLAILPLPQAFATSDEALRRFYHNCQIFMKSSPEFQAKVAKGAHLSVAKITSSCRLELSYSLERVLAYEHEYLNWERHRHSGGGLG